jgi:hypothetical protein
MASTDSRTSNFLSRAIKEKEEELRSRAWLENILN